MKSIAAAAVCCGLLAFVFHLGRLSMKESNSRYEIKSFGGVPVRVDKQAGTVELLRVKPSESAKPAIGSDFVPEKPNAVWSGYKRDPIITPTPNR